MEKKNLPTKDRLKKAREDGQIVKSQDLLRLASLAIMFEIANLVFGPLLAQFSELVNQAILAFEQPFSEALESLAIIAVQFFVMVSLTAALTIALIKIVVSWLQFGFIFSTKPFSEGFKKLNPMTQLSQYFSLSKLWELFASMLKLTLIALIGYVMYRQIFPELIRLPELEVYQVWPVLNSLFMFVERNLMLLLIALAALDIGVQRLLYQRRLKMTDQEVKQEQKNRDGDPIIKHKRRSLAQQFLFSNDPPKLDTVKDADVVVVNPTHIAVALTYDPNKVPLPVVRYMATDDGALETIAYAQEHKVPVIRYLWLARTLHGECKVGQTIPRETIQATAALFKAVKEIQAQHDSDAIDATDEIVEIYQ